MDAQHLFTTLLSRRSIRNGDSAKAPFINIKLEEYGNMFFVDNDQAGGLPGPDAEKKSAMQQQEEGKQYPEADYHLSDRNAIRSSPTPAQYMRYPKTIA